jgi:hypothetical protein
MKTPATPLYVAAIVAASTLLWWMGSAERADERAYEVARGLIREHGALALDGQARSPEEEGIQWGTPTPDEPVVPELVDDSGPDYVVPAVLRIRWPDGARGSLWHQDLLLV